ncbi:MAG: hypothetical protein JKY42_02440 [Flavobacteriales bacterium]|nr:hypothetical protein [Flavobacteriales bacterium]
MRRGVAIGLVLCSVMAFSSCKKTTICTYTDDETGVVTTDTVETNKVLHKAAVNQHTKTGWICD